MKDVGESQPTDSSPVAPGKGAVFLHAAGRVLRRDIGLFLPILLLAVGMLLVQYGKRTDNFWVDEIFTASIVNMTVGDLVETSALDAHPPLYYLALKTWLKPFRMMGIEPGLLLHRGPGIVAHLLFVCIAWVVLRRFLGRSTGALATVVLAFAPTIVQYATEMRQYSLVIPAGGVCWMLMTGLFLSEQGDRRLSRGLFAAWWALYALLAAAMMWTHLLTGPLLAWFGVLWFVYSLLLWRRAGRFFLFGLASQVLALLLFAPYVETFRENYSYINQYHLWWMTPAEPANLWGALLYWGIFGRANSYHISSHWGALIIGFIGVLLPLLFLPAALFAARNRDRRFRPGLVFGLSGVGVGIAYVLTLYLLSARGVVQVFHAPRYPMIATPLLLGGLIALSGWSLARMRLHVGWAWLLASFLLGYCYFHGHRHHFQHTTLGLLHEYIAQGKEPFMPGEGEALIVMPSEFLPIVRQVLPQYEHRRVESLLGGHPPDEPITILNMNPWPWTRHPRDIELLAAALRGELGHDFTASHFGMGKHVVQIRTPDAEMLERLARLPLYLALDRESDDVVSMAQIVAQPAEFGWQYPEWKEAHVVEVTARRPEVRVVLDRPLPAGRFVMQFTGYNHYHPVHPAEFRISVPGTDFHEELTIGGGPFDERLTFEVKTPIENPVVTIQRETFIPHEINEEWGDWRPISFALRGLQIRESAPGDDE